MLNNNVTLSDDELSVIQTSLKMNLLSLEAYENQGNVLDFASQETKNDMQKLFDRLDKEYF